MQISKEKFEFYIEELNKEIICKKDELNQCKDYINKLKNASISEVTSSLKNTPLTIDSLTPEILNKFIKRIEISETGDAKIFYRFSAPNISQ